MNATAATTAQFKKWPPSRTRTMLETATTGPAVATRDHLEAEWDGDGRFADRLRLGPERHGAVTAPSGATWTLIRRDVDSGRRGRPELLGAGGSPRSVTPAGPGPAPAAPSARSAATRGIDPINPIDVTSGASGTKAGNLVAASVTTTAVNETIVGGFGRFGNSTFTPPAGMHLIRSDSENGGLRSGEADGHRRRFTEVSSRAAAWRVGFQDLDVKMDFAGNCCEVEIKDL